MDELDEEKMLEMANSQDKDELLSLMRLVNDLKLKLDEATEASKKDRQRANRMEIASLISAEDWKLELEAMQKQYQLEIFRLQKENKDLKYEIVGANEAKEAALQIAREAMLASENAAKQTASLSVELEKAMAATVASREETLACMHMLEEIAKQRVDLSEAYEACQKSSQAGAVIVAEKEAELKKQMTALFQAKQEAELLRWELFESRKSETRLCEMTNELEYLEMQLAMARQTEEQQAKVAMKTDTELQEAHHEVEEAIAAKNELAALLASVQIELKDNRQKIIGANAEVAALTARTNSIKDELETEHCQSRMLQRKNSKLETQCSEALEKLEGSLTREKAKEDALIQLECSFEASKVELQILQQQVYEAVFDAQLSEMETTKELMCILLILRNAECAGLKSGILTGMCLDRDIDVLRLSLPGIENENLMGNSHETFDLSSLPVSLELALAACKRAALAISLELKVTETQLDRAGEEAKIIVELTSEPCEVKEPSMQESPAHRNPVMEETLTSTSKANQFQNSSKQEKPRNMKVEVQGKFRDLSEPWEIVNPGCEATVTIKREEYDSLRLSIHEAMELQSLNESQLMSLRMSHQRLMAQLEAKNVELKALRLSEQSMFDQYDQLQQQNIILEAEMRSLQERERQCSKSWEVDANALHSSRGMKFDKQHSIGRDLSSSEKEEEESSEFLSLSSKKKKKALYLRIGTFLTKKIN